MKSNIDINALISLFSFMLALFTTASGAILWYVNSEKKKYAAERDFAHLKRNQEAISQSVAALLEEFDRRQDVLERDILEIKSYISRKSRNDE